jgi:hypothetical protein
MDDGRFVICGGGGNSGAVNLSGGAGVVAGPGIDGPENGLNGFVDATVEFLTAGVSVFVVRTCGLLSIEAKDLAAAAVFLRACRVARGSGACRDGV